MRRLMILGAGIYQVPLIQKAKEMGLFTIAVSCPGPYPGFALADKVYQIDTTDQEQVLRAARSEKIDGICTSGTDVAVRSVGFVCEELGLCGLSSSSAVLATDKAKMKQAFVRGGVSTAFFRKVHSSEEALAAFSELKPPVMVKAADSSGSRGVSRADTRSSFLEAYQAACRVTKKPYVLVEKFLDGREIGVDGFLQNGRWKLLLPHDKYLCRTGQTAIPAGHSFPFACPVCVENEIHAQMTLAARALGLDNCAVNADLMLCGDRAFLLEMGGRAGATGIPELISCYTGTDYYEQIIRNALGESADFSCAPKIPCISRLLFSPRSGVVTQIREDTIAGLRSQDVSIHLDYRTGDHVSRVRNGTDRIGSVICRGSLGQSVEELEQSMNHIVSLLQSSIFVDGIPL